MVSGHGRNFNIKSGDLDETGVNSPLGSSFLIMKPSIRLKYMNNEEPEIKSSNI